MTDRQELMSQVFHSYQLNPRIKSTNVNKFYPKDIRNKNYILSHTYAGKRGWTCSVRKGELPKALKHPQLLVQGSQLCRAVSGVSSILILKQIFRNLYTLAVL